GRVAMEEPIATLPGEISSLSFVLPAGLNHAHFFHSAGCEPNRISSSKSRLMSLGDIMVSPECHRENAFPPWNPQSRNARRWLASASSLQCFVRVTHPIDIVIVFRLAQQICVLQLRQEIVIIDPKNRS
ncbi:MAG TPA: hypothetical protein VGO27_13615, partial [Candidatus Acidoferrum sp.]|nr:hypothetical protein [Candidatus Acidoferrum sp.]